MRVGRLSEIKGQWGWLTSLFVQSCGSLSRSLTAFPNKPMLLSQSLWPCSGDLHCLAIELHRSGLGIGVDQEPGFEVLQGTRLLLQEHGAHVHALMEATDGRDGRISQGQPP